MNSLIRIDRPSQALIRVPQRAIPKAEFAAYAVLPAALIVAGIFPVAGLFALPAALVCLYISYRRFGAYFPLCCVLFYGLFALVLNYDVLSVIYFVALFFGFVGVVLSCQTSPYLVCAFTAAVITVAGAFVGVGIVRLAENKPIGDIAASYVTDNADDFAVKFFAYEYYDASDPAPDEKKLSRGEAGYHEAATAAFADYANDEFTHYIWYYCIHYGSVFAAVAFFVANILNGRTASAFDSGASADELEKSTRALGGVKKPVTPLCDMKLPRAYLWACLLPATVTAVVLDLVGGYDFIASTVMHTFATLPSAFGCFTLLYYFAKLFKGRANIAANVFVALLGALAVLFPIALFAISIIGVCDCILNIRYWVEFIRTD